ncbi:MAG: helix-turn-helix domain-containing protein [Chroococcidiopsidaceae cyanobacterium CP_BM_ER_R8_30]|nr:helix-turn-helix domain-containing protein [Chroococcidiopsidaceae cyanobacterium CP_BM_ER_R8_30]
MNGPSSESAKVKPEMVLRESTEAEGEWEIVQNREALPLEVQRRLEVMQSLMVYQGTDRYAQMQRQAARKLGITVRSVQRLVKSWREQGLAGLTKKRRSDRGTAKTSQEWQNFIVKTYQEGNRALLILQLL